MRIPGFTSTASKRPEAVFGVSDPGALPARVVRAAGCRVWDEQGREYTDYLMALGAVSLGYGHPEVNRAAMEAIEAGVVGPLPPPAEATLAERLAEVIPWIEQVRFLKTGAEAVAAAVRIARAYTRREVVLRSGYHGWLDWCQGAEVPGVPPVVAALSEELPFNDVDRGRSLIRLVGERLAAVVVEPVIHAAPHAAWLAMLREECLRAGAVLVFDEVKTAFRLAVGGAAERYGVRPDLVVLGKALANGFPLAAVGGSAEVMGAAARTWISSTLATEAVALAAARAALEVTVREQVPARLAALGSRWLLGLSELVQRYPDLLVEARGIPEMCYLVYRSEELGAAVAREAAARGLLVKRSAYNFVSLAHTEEIVDASLDRLDAACRAVKC
jgi:glutamate-1-semialdehyde 2,1-aminomutase